MKNFNRTELRSKIHAFVTTKGHFPTRREFRAIASERVMYREFGGMKDLQLWYSSIPATTHGSLKDQYLTTLRSAVCIVKYEKNGCDRHHALTLSPTILKPYVGKGTSKNADSDTIFAYDTDAEVFRKVEVSKIKSCIPLQ